MQGLTWKKRIQENIKSYRLENLYELQELQTYFSALAKVLKTPAVLADRNGEMLVCAGEADRIGTDVVREQGQGLRIEKWTIGYLYIDMTGLLEEEKETARAVWDGALGQMLRLGEAVYLERERSIYLVGEEQRMEKGLETGVREDTLTGMLSRAYFESRLQVMERAEIVPVAVICGNINDWQYVNGTWGGDESDRLIQTIAGFMKGQAKPEYVIGRNGGDDFRILIPLPEEGEAEDYCKRVQEQCNAFDDEKLAPSIAFGIVYKTNIEEVLDSLFSEAEYEMFQDKLELKEAAGYKERLTAGINYKR